MAQVRGTKGNNVSIQFRGIVGVLANLKITQNDIKTKSEAGLIKAAAHVQESLKDSIAGNKSETKSVDTGTLVNDIKVSKVSSDTLKVSPGGRRYSKGKSNTEDVALHLEHGTSRLAPRRHFGNTKTREQGKVKDIIKDEVRRAL